MTKRPPQPPKAHSTCGHPLQSILLAEIVPIRSYYFGNKIYTEGDVPDTTPEIITVWICSDCLRQIENGDLEYFQKRLKVESTEE